MKAKILNLGLIKVTCRSEQKCLGITGVTVHYVPLVCHLQFTVHARLSVRRFLSHVFVDNLGVNSTQGCNTLDLTNLSAFYKLLQLLAEDLSRLVSSGQVVCISLQQATWVDCC